MTTLTTTRPAPSGAFKQFVTRHPLVSYFTLAYLGAWLFIAPILLSQMALKIITLPDPLLLVLFLLATYAGPAPAAFLVTGITEGRDGIRRLLHRMVQWRVGLRWYLLVILAYPLVFLVGLAVLHGGALLTDLGQNWPLFVTFYLPTLAFGMLYPALGEEPGWRGFALPRLQQSYGPLLGGLILGTLHAFWHLPAYFIPGAISDGGFDPHVFLGNSLAIIAATLIWNWLFNSVGGSIFFAMFVHATSNAASGLIPRLINDPTSDPYFGFKVVLVLALLVVIFTRGRLGYKAEAPALVVDAQPVPA